MRHIIICSQFSGLDPREERSEKKWYSCPVRGANAYMGGAVGLPADKRKEEAIPFFTEQHRHQVW